MLNNSNKINKLFLFLAKIRNTRIKQILIFMLALVICYLVRENQYLWITQNCTVANNPNGIANSCIYKFQRLNLIPIAVFIFLYAFFFLDKVYLLINNFEKFINSVSKNKQFIFNFLICSLIVVYLFYLKFTFIPLNPLNVTWLQNKGDWNQHFLGWYVFYHSSWTFPIGIIPNLNYPMGISVGYTDPIPFLAIIFKFFKDYLPTTFQYSGLWLFSCYILQTLFVSLILKNWNTSFFYKVLSTLLIALSPILLNRSAHIALNAHWLILVSFFLYFSKNNLWYHTALLIFSAWIHPYFTFMLCILHVGHVAKFYFENKKIKIAISHLVTPLCVIIFSWYLLGYFELKGQNIPGIGYFSSNLNAFFNPLGASSIFLATQPVWGGQYEGYAYLGAGLILLLFIVTFENNRQRNILFKKKNFFLILSVLLLAFIALSNNVRLNSFAILSYPLPKFILNFIGAFQSTGRFIWPLWYFIAIFTLCGWLIKKRNKYKKFILFFIVAIIQFIDIFPLIINTGSIQAGQNIPTTIHPDQWLQFLGANKNKILFYPPYLTFYNNKDDYTDFWYLAGKHHLTVNMGYLARSNKELEKKYTEEMKEQIQIGQLRQDAIYVSKITEKKIFSSALIHNLIECKTIDNYFVCKIKE